MSSIVNLTSGSESAIASGGGQSVAASDAVNNKSGNKRAVQDLTVNAKANSQSPASDTVNVKSTTINKSPDVEQKVENIDEAIDIVSAFMNQPPRNVSFAKDNNSGKTVIKVIDTESKELIKQFPSEEVLAIAERIKELQQEVGIKTGMLLDENV